MAKLFARRQVLTAGAAGVAIAGLSACSNSTSASGPTEEELASSTPSSGPATKVIATTTDVPVGGVFNFTDPNSGMPAYLLQPAAGTFIAYSSKCTHQGCVVDAFPDANAFKCACHGAKYDLATGAPDEATSKSLTATPLAKIALTVEGDQISVA
jgi:thiosulfate dehydrogenase [quinone] large subunit